MAEYKVAHIDEIEPIDDGRVPMRPVRGHLEITAFGANAFTAAKAGDRVINEHAEDQPKDPEELYVVVSGHARFQVGDETIDAPQGTMVFVPPGPRRTAFAEADATTVLAIGATAGQAYEPTGWEIFTPLDPLYNAGDWDPYIERAKPMIEANPEYPVAFYNLACVESRAGRKDEAIEHLRTAIERWPRAKTLAVDDSDFDSIRDEPGFRELVA
jgi:mannose-6-phosphate isomerase-like protein (cupin superfamily)